MAPSNPSVFVAAANKPMTRAASTSTRELQPLGADLQDAFTAGVRTDQCLTREVSGELGYGCVDWFIYANDSTGVPTAALHTGND